MKKDMVFNLLKMRLKILIQLYIIFTVTFSRTNVFGVDTTNTLNRARTSEIPVGLGPLSTRTPSR